MKRTQKELSLLKDLKNEEKICTEKCEMYSKQACDPQLKELFTKMADTENCHYNAVCEMEQGIVPEVDGVCASLSKSFKPCNSCKPEDSYFCADALSNEKRLSHLFDTCIFEFTDEPSREVLNKIQKNEQNHGKILYDYMKANNMYS